MQTHHDIFISYAHIDNQPLVSDTEGWVSQFHHALEVRVDQLLGKKSSIWRDLKLKGNDYFDQKIIDQLPNVGVLVSVLSPRYVHSDWCVRELDAFCRASQQSGGQQIGEKTRIFKVIKTPVPIEEHPINIRNVLGYEFFTMDNDTGRARELNKVFGGEAERAFWLKLDDLAQDLCDLLMVLGKTDPSQDTGTEPKDAVLVANASFDIQEQYEAIRRDLLGQNVRVLPDRPLPPNINELIPFLQEMLAQCCMSIHPVGKFYDMIPEGANRSLMELENELAVEREEQGGFSRLVWIPPSLKVEDEQQRHFIEKLRSDPRIQYGGDLLETPLEDLKTQIHEILKPNPPIDIESTRPPASISPLSSSLSITSNKPESSSLAENDEELISVYLICDSRDLDDVTSLADYLFDKGYEVILPAFEGDEAEVREDHEDNLCRADAVMIYYANANDLWLRRKLREVRKSAGMGRTEPLEAKAIFVAPPNSSAKQWLRSHEALVIHQGNEFTAEILDPFLANLHN